MIFSIILKINLTIGKPAGNDLRQGMVTLPLIYALQTSPSGSYQQQVQSLLNGAKHTETEILDVVSWVSNSYGIEQSLKDADIYAQKAREALYHFPASPDRDVLDELIDFVIRRKR